MRLHRRVLKAQVRGPGYKRKVFMQRQYVWKPRLTKPSFCILQIKRVIGTQAEPGQAVEDRDSGHLGGKENRKDHAGCLGCCNALILHQAAGYTTESTVYEKEVIHL